MKKSKTKSKGTNRNNLIEIAKLKKELFIRRARDDFYIYCRYREPDFYQTHRTHLKILCDTLNDFYYGKLLKDNGDFYSKLMIRFPPQFGKSRTLVNFAQWCLGKNERERIITASHTDGQAADFSKYTRNGIMEEKNTSSQQVFSDIFPNTKIRRGDASKQKWALEGQFFNYLGVGVGGAVTGKGATIRIIDDLIKDIEEAMSKTQLRKKWLWFSGTFTSRKSSETAQIKEIFCATLWNENDPQAVLESEEAGDWYVLSMEVKNEETGELLCEDFMDEKTYQDVKKRMCKDEFSKIVFYANYHAKKKKLEGVLLKPSELKYFAELNKEVLAKANIVAGIDTADGGTDYYCMVIGAIIKGLCYIIDVIFINERITICEGLTISKNKQYGIDNCILETNKEGTLYIRDLREKMGSTTIYPLFNTANKHTRILTQAGFISEKFVFLEESKRSEQYQRYFENLTSYMLTGAQETNDDAPDCTALLARFIKQNYYLE